MKQFNLIVAITFIVLTSIVTGFVVDAALHDPNPIILDASHHGGSVRFLPV